MLATIILSSIPDELSAWQAQAHIAYGYRPGLFFRRARCKIGFAGELDFLIYPKQFRSLSSSRCQASS